MSCSHAESKHNPRRRARLRKLSCSSRSESSRWSWSALKNLSCSDAHERSKLVYLDHGQLTISRQCQLLVLARSTHNFKPVGVRDSTLPIMVRIDAIYLDDSSSGSHRIVHYLAREGIPISRDRVRNLMHRMGLRAIYQKPRTTIPGSPSERFPCLVDLDKITFIDQLWATDSTYIPLRKGFLYLVAIMDLFSRIVLSSKPANSVDTQVCMDALEMALAYGSRPEIFHSDLGCQFTLADYMAKL